MIDEVPESIGHLIPPYIAQTKRDARTLVTLLAEQRFEEIRGIAHDLKGSGSTYGFPELTELGKQLTAAADREDRATAEEVIAQLKTFTRSAAVLMHARLDGLELEDSRWLASKILVIDDSPAILKIAAAMLRKDGHQVHIQSSAEQGLLSLQTLRPDAILVDLRLPGLNGLDFTRRVRKDPVTQDTIVLAMTAYSGAEIEKAAAEAGFDGFITKPFDADRLTMFVRRNLQRESQIRAQAPAPAVPRSEKKAHAFLEDISRQSQALVMDFDAGFQTSKVSRMLRRWAAEARQFGYGSIPPLAEEAAELLEGLCWEPAYLKESLNRLVVTLHALEKEQQEIEVSSPPSGDLDALSIALSPAEGIAYKDSPSSIELRPSLP